MCLVRLLTHLNIHNHALQQVITYIFDQRGVFMFNENIYSNPEIEIVL